MNTTDQMLIENGENLTESVFGAPKAAFVARLPTPNEFKTAPITYNKKKYVFSLVIYDQL